MNNDKELLKQALYYMDDNCGPYTDDYQKLIEAIRARLSQCDRCGEVNPAEIHTCTPKQAYPENFIDALRYHTAINEQPEQEPVAWHEPGAYSNVTAHEKWAKENGWLPLYTAPPQREEGCAECGKKASEGWALYCVKCSEPVREWQGLTDQEQLEIMKQFGPGQRGLFADAIEAKLKEKNT